MDDLERLLAIFGQESAEYLDKLTQLLDGIGEAEPEDRERNLNDAVHVAHNFKGASRAAGLEKLAARVHELEDALISEQKSADSTPESVVRELIDKVTELQRFTEGELSSRNVPGMEEPKGEREGEGRAGENARVEDDGGSDSAPDGAQKISEHSESEDGDMTIRVASSRLDRLMSHAGEMLVTHSRMDEKHKDLLKIEEMLKVLGTKPSLKGDELSEVVGAMQRIVRQDQEDLLAFDYLSQEISDTVKRVRMTPLQDLAPLIRRTVRETSYDLGKQIKLKLDLGKIELDKSLLTHLRGPLLHLLRNAIDHGIESVDERVERNKPSFGQIRIVAFMERSFVRIEVSDDGRGLNDKSIGRSAVERGLIEEAQLGRMTKEEILSLIFSTSFSTARAVSHTSGRGMGLSVVKQELEKVGGRAEISPTSSLGGTTFYLTMPVNVLSINGLLLRTAEQIYAVPIDDVSRIVKIKADSIRQVDGSSVIATEELEPTRIVWLTSLLGEAQTAPRGTVRVLILERGTRHLGLVVPEIMGEREFIIEPLPWNLTRVPFINGAIIMADGKVALSLDVAVLFDATFIAAREQFGQISSSQQSSPRILVVDDSLTVRTLHRNILSSAGFDVEVTVDGSEAWKMLEQNEYDLLVSDINMPRMDGFELTRKVRSTEKLKTLPVILVTNLDQKGDVEKGAEAGADEYIVKGKFDNEQLLKAVNRLLDR